MTRLFAFAHFGLLLLTCITVAAESERVPASALADRLLAKEEGTSYIRLRMKTSSGEEGILQLQIKSRGTREKRDLVYQILFPKERKGESVLLQRAGGRISGTVFTPPGTIRPLGAAQLNQPLFGSELSYEDVIDSPFAWEQQAIVGTEAINGISCQILESKPGKGHQASYSKVRTWVDPSRFVPMRIEKYGSSGKLVRQIATRRLLRDGDDSIPANLSVLGPRGAVTELDGSRIKRGVTFADREFTPIGLKELTPQPDSPK